MPKKKDTKTRNTKPKAEEKALVKEVTPEETAPVEAKPEEAAPEAEAPTDRRAFAHTKNRTMIIPGTEAGTIQVRSWHTVTSNPKVATYLEKQNDFIEIPPGKVNAFVSLVKASVTPNVRACAEAVRGQ